MASSLELVQHIAEQINSLGLVHYRKMFGEYLIYLDAKPLFLVCDNTLFVKITPKTEAYLKDREKGHPYPGAKLHYVISDLDHKDYLCSIALLLR